VFEQLRDKPTSDYTVDEVKLVLTHLGVKHDPSVIDKHNADGNTLGKLTTSSHVRARLGIKSYGTACFLQHALQYSQVNQLPLSVVLPLNALPPTADNVMSWRVDETCQWLAQHRMHALEPAFRKHEINGAVLVFMDVVEFSNFDESVLEYEHDLQQARSVLLTDRKPLIILSL
jgi:hypothetical protein